MQMTLGADAAGQRFLLRNPLKHSVTRVPVAVPLPGANPSEAARIRAVDSASGEVLLSQCDVFPASWPGCPVEAVLLVDLSPGGVREVSLKARSEGAATPESGPRIVATDRGAYTFDDGLLTFRLTGRPYRHPRLREREFKLRHLDRFRFVAREDVPTGIGGFGTANQCFQLGNYVEEPSVTVIRGPARATLCLCGKAAIFSFGELVDGEAFVASSIYAGMGVVDTRCHFRPSSPVT